MKHPLIPNPWYQAQIQIAAEEWITAQSLKMWEYKATEKYILCFPNSCYPELFLPSSCSTSSWASKATDMFCACLVSQLCLTLCNLMDCSPPGSSVHGILQATRLKWVAMPSSRGSSQPRDRTQVSHIAGGFFTSWATREALVNVSICANKNIICALKIVQDAQGWCIGMTQRDGMGREVGEGFRIGNTCTPVADLCWCMAKLIQYCKVIRLQLK